MRVPTASATRLLTSPDLSWSSSVPRVGRYSVILDMVMVVTTLKRGDFHDTDDSRTNTLNTRTI